MLIQKNPWTIVGTISRCWLFTFQSEIAVAQALIPPGLELVTHRDCAFWNVVVCRLTAMQPRILPLALGLNYWHVAYRLYVRCYPKNGEPIEGLYFLRSDCDDTLVTIVGNLFTDFNFHKAAIEMEESDEAVFLKVHSPDASAHARLSKVKEPQLADHSVFASLEEAAEFLKYKPNGISVDHFGNANVVHIDRDEDEWTGKLVDVEEATWAFFDKLPVRPEICYEVEPIYYQWNKGKIYPLKRKSGD